MSVAQVSKCRSVGLEADSTRINKEVIVLKGKSVEKLIASGCEKLSSGGAVPAAATEEKKADKKIEGSGFEDDMDCGLFEQGNIPRDHIPGAASVTASFGPRRQYDGTNCFYEIQQEGKRSMLIVHKQKKKFNIYLFRFFIQLHVGTFGFELLELKQ